MRTVGVLWHAAGLPQVVPCSAGLAGNASLVTHLCTDAGSFWTSSTRDHALEGSHSRLGAQERGPFQSCHLVLWLPPRFYSNSCRLHAFSGAFDAFALDSFNLH